MKQNFWKIRAFLEAGSSYLTNDVREGNPCWGEAPLTNIARIEFPFVGIEHGLHVPFILSMSGMAAYNFFADVSRSLSNGSDSIQGLWLLGRLPPGGQVAGVVIGAQNIAYFKAPFGTEYLGAPTVGWRPGAVGERPILHVRRLT